MTKYYIIKHKPTGRTLPARILATHWDPARPAGEPRLFSTERAAKNCATCWAQGAWAKTTRVESDGWESPQYTVESEPIPEVVPGRQRADLEVVAVTLL